MNKDNNWRYIKKIITIICLTNIPFILFLPFNIKLSIGWIFGSVGSIANILWLAKSVSGRINFKKNRVEAVKNFYLRYAVLILYSVLVVALLKPDIIIFGLGLLSAQIVIYLYELYRRIKRNKYFKG